MNVNRRRPLAAVTTALGDAEQKTVSELPVGLVLKQSFLAATVDFGLSA
ncbi:hypothetical protein [Novipirellula artificiosorum]|uniref:Uncharacterized protein n=1 Tax=Novipirellula artificiosorum TaxID=2528016 RepID=A0A5C6CRQ3_9BACT|nr:hypothetical protein [Novipirellula artificiosorum]TWU26141.1 hypothetical protein Poly41_70660 [Novipirellula artificiosorum]